MSVPAAAETEPTNTTPADPAGQSTPDATPQTDPDPAGAEALGDPGKKALDAMKAAKREAEQKARDAEAKLAEALAKIEGKEKEFAAEQERRKVEAEALTKANQRILKAEIRAQAAGKLSDPADALLYLDLSKFDVGDDGEVDAAAVRAAVEDLIKTKPYLAAQGGAPGPVFESPTSRREGETKSQLTRDQLKGMTPEQIVAAKAEGRLDTVLGIKH